MNSFVCAGSSALMTRRKTAPSGLCDRPFATPSGQQSRRDAGLRGPATPDAGVAAGFLLEQIGEAFEHNATQLLGIDNRHGAAVVARDVVADADRGQLDSADTLDLADNLAQMLFEIVTGVDRQCRIID